MPVDAEDAAVFPGFVGIWGNGLVFNGHVCIHLHGA